MKTIKSIEDKLREVAKSNNLSGDSVELIIKLLAYNQYEANLSTRISLLESLPNRAVNLNSKIEHAVNEMYSLFRGENAKLELKLKITGNLNFSRFKEAYSDRYNTFYFSHITTEEGKKVYSDFNYGQTYNVTLIKSEEIREEILSADKDNKYILETLSGNISEDYFLRPNLDYSVPLVTTKNFGTHVDSSLKDSVVDSKLVFDLTTTDYGVRFYSPDKEGFNTSINYKLVYAPFSNDSIDYNDLDSLNIKGSEIDYDSFKIIEPVDRESVNNFLYNLKKNLLVQGRVRSNSDVLDEFKSKFSSKIMDCSLGDYNLSPDELTINYIPKDSNLPMGTASVYEISEEERKNYIDKLLYYVTKNIKFKALYDYESSVSIQLQLNMVVDRKIDTSLISNYLSTKEYRLGESFNQNEFIGYVNNVEGVLYSTLQLLDSTGNKITEDIKLNKDKYFILLNNFTYTYKI